MFSPPATTTTTTTTATTNLRALPTDWAIFFVTASLLSNDCHLSNRQSRLVGSCEHLNPNRKRGRCGLSHLSRICSRSYHHVKVFCEDSKDKKYFGEV